MKNPCSLLLLIASMFVLASCGKEEDSSASNAADDSDSLQTSSGSQPISVTAQDINPQERSALTGGELTLSVSSFAENWNPMHVDGNNRDNSDILSSMLPAFFLFDEAGVPTPNPDYVLSVEVVREDPTEVRYKLNPDAVWGDGSPVDGEDMIAKWKACNGDNPEFSCVSTEHYEPIASIVLGEDKADVTVTYKSSFPDWSQGFSSPGVIRAESIMDAEVFNGGWSELNNDWLSGPFKVGSFDETQQVMTLIPNQDWWGESPVLESIVWRAIAPDAVAQAFANREIDAFDIGSDPDAYQRASRVENAQVRKAGGPNFRHFTFNSKAGLLQDVTIRQAVVYGLDRQSIAASDLAGIDWPVKPLNNHVFLQGQAGFVDTASVTGLDYNPEKARALLDEAGWIVGDDGVREKDNQKLVLRFTQVATVKASENEALQAQSMLKDIGIQLDIVTVPVSRFGPTLTGHEFEIIAFSWIGTPYPFSGIKQLYGTGSGSNFAQLSMPEVDELAEQIAFEIDPEKRIALANKADEIIWTNVHTLPLYQRPELIAVRSDLANYGAFGLSSVQWENVGFMK
ncbi:MAG: ABC transporter family substrate-binding protein [Gammaproteobacteria bacterium]|nr:ABC transporter family substrate-binding protein [Gammaproteobacteria bacterium]